MSEETGRSARHVAADVLTRIERDGAYANLALGPALSRSDLDEQDRRFATELVYGTTRMRRACDSLVDRYVTSPPDERTRTILRLGAYQLAFAGVAPHAAVGETVGLAPKRTRGFVNAVLRKVARLDVSALTWPSEAARLSYPDWIVELLTAELGDESITALERMNQAPPVTERADGYVQDESSQWVAAGVEVAPGERILDVCAAPGGKATALASAGATVVAADRGIGRSRLIVDNARRLGLDVPVVTADSTAPPFRPGSFDAVLLDAPCSGLGALRRRADARWRIQRSDVVELAALQRSLLSAVAPLVAPGGRLVYSVCTLGSAESVDHPTPDGFEVDETPPTVGEWRAYRQGWRVLPQDADTDGMTMIRYRRRR
ncbi:MAG: transcription antitermination factor NusB [Ilumatobacter sp.]|uniref:transcription antitermination factor NusB n=1 Tax=Ilumatobacter sp. TaxID=1967498 RepID=UPI00391D11C3